MHSPALMLSLVVSLAGLGVGAPAAHGITEIRQTKGKFCEKSTAPLLDSDVRARHDKFVDAFLVKKDVVEAFTYIAPEYIVSCSHLYHFAGDVYDRIC